MPTRQAPKQVLAYQKLWVILGWLMVTAVVYVSLTPSPPALPAQLGDKVAHILAYAWLMFWFSSLYTGRARMMSGVGFVFVGFVLEVLQGLAGHRSAEAMDMLANVAGVVCAWVLASTRAGGFLKDLDRWLARHRDRR